MKAIFFEEHGGVEVLKYAEIPDPEPVPGEALIRVKAVALNHLDIWIRRGWKGLRLPLPHITGSDICGEVVRVNAQSAWTVGSRVIINPGISSADDEWTRRGEDSVSPGYKIIGENVRGGLAELVCVPIQNVFKAPDSWNDEEAAAPLLVATTCWRMLFKRGDLRPGESVLVVGSGGGVNSLVIAMAKSAGARVYALAGNQKKADQAKKLGADFVLNYNDHPEWPVEIFRLTHGRGVDMVIDNVGAATLPKSIRAVSRGGRIVTVGNTSGYEVQLDNRQFFVKQISLIGSTMGSRQDFLDAVSFLLERNIKIPIDTVAPLKDGIKQIKRMEDGDHFGKIVLKP